MTFNKATLAEAMDHRRFLLSRSSIFLLVLWFVVSESFSHPFKSNAGFSYRQGNRLHRTILPKHARMMFSGIVEVVAAISNECELSLL